MAHAAPVFAQSAQHAATDGVTLAATSPPLKPTDDSTLLPQLPHCIGAGGGGGGGGGGGVRLVCCSNRSLGSVVGCEALLEPGHYLVLPLSLRPSSVAGPLRVVLRVAAYVEKG